MLSKNYIIGSSLPQEDKNLWFILLEKTPKNQLQVFDGFIENREENLRMLTLNIRTKMDAFLRVDEKAIEKLFKEEQEVLL